jgi:hypothetical protein
MDSRELFWSSFVSCLANNAPQYFKDSTIIKTGSDFSKLFEANKWKRKVVLFVDKYDTLESADDKIISSFLKTVRGIKATKDNYAIWSINAIGPFSILHLSSKEVTTSPFNVKEPFQNPNFTREQVQALFKKFEAYQRKKFDPEIINDIYMRTNGYV